MEVWISQRVSIGSVECLSGAKEIRYVLEEPGAEVPVKASSRRPSREQDGFEQVMKHFSYSLGPGKHQLGKLF
jgi:hypothetical protein